MRFLSILFSCVFAVSLLGCGSGLTKAKLYPVTGKVTSGGKPLTGCTLLLVAVKPTKGSDGSFIGVLDENGEYVIADSSGAKGIALGKYKVTFTRGVATDGKPDSHEMFQAVMKGSAKQGAKEAPPFPKEYSSADTSRKEVEITAETKELDIAI